MARTKKQFTEKEISKIERLVAEGNSFRYICSYVGLTDRAVRNRSDLMDAINKGKAKANSQVLKTMYKMATRGDNFKATKWWLAVHEKMIEPTVEINSAEEMTKLNIALTNDETKEAS